MTEGMELRHPDGGPLGLSGAGGLGPEGDIGFFRFLLDTVDAMIALVDSDYIYRFVNRSYLDRY